MQFEVDKQTLLKALNTVNGAVEKKNTIPVLQNVKIEAKDSKITFCTTDMDVLVTSNFKARTEKNGATTTPAQMFFDIIRKIPDDSPIKISQEDPNTLKINSKKLKYKLPCIDATEFPSISEGEFENEIIIDSKSFCKMVDKTRFAISNDETRYYLNGLFLQSLKVGDKFQLRCVATDGHRLAMSKLKCDALENEFGVIIPKKSINEIRRVIDSSKSAKVEVSKNKVKVTADQSSIVSKLIDGQFPDYEKVLPKGNDQIASIVKKPLYDSVDRISTVASDKHRSVKFGLNDNKITLQIDSNDGSFAHEELETDYKGNEIEIGFNSKYLLDVIGQVDKDELLMKFKDGNSPALVEAENFDSVFVIMPVRI